MGRIHYAQFFFGGGLLLLCLLGDLDFLLFFLEGIGKGDLKFCEGWVYSHPSLSVEVWRLNMAREVTSRPSTLDALWN